ncbi:dephospho-CoA kinase [Flavobacterium sp. SUN046]|uniref:dephospho-CoA kinase n=1 Tax=Flavobacterium sp. SUN046 TaxID=3002440 RepID=UPI002DB5B8F2|nr:dephospho-CoA kinase [Flavobacterium sp. SUN046]MEC4050556.1 dephospho-CoA kinase [Flavobacterium sp. SUN046]
MAFPGLFFKKPTEESKFSKEKVFEKQSNPITIKTPVTVNTIELNPASIQFEAKPTTIPLPQEAPKVIVEQKEDKAPQIQSEYKVQKPLIIGLTGGIGSGKTTLANYLKSLGVPVYISDVEAKKVMEFPEIIAQIKEAFDQDILKEGKLDREKLAGIVFNKPDQLKLLNSIVHPAVKKHFESWIQQNYHHPILFKEAAILFESGSYKDCDAIVSVIAPLETRIERVLQRDKTTREKVLQRIHNQISDEERTSRSQYVVNNLDFEEAKKSMNEILLSISKR